MKKLTILYYLTAWLLMIFTAGCKKLIEIEPPKHTLTEEKVFKDDSSAVAVLLNIYQASVSAQLEENITTRSSMCADEMTTTIATYFQFTGNNIEPGESGINNLWKGLYATIYRCNLLLENLDRSAAITEPTRRQLAGEARFLRALAYFYLVNQWGDVPLLLTTDVRTTSTAARTTQPVVYQQIIADLKEAQSELPTGYPGGEKIRANRHAATALLARTYLYRQQWAAAETEATKILESGLYAPLPAPNSVFVKSSREAILQWWNQTGNTGLGSFFIPLAGSVPSYQSSDTVRNSFETGDNRKTTWIGSTTVSGQPYYYPYKYRQRTAASGANGEYTVVLRAAEQYLIRAEARAQQGKTGDAVADLNVIRTRSGLPALPNTLSKEDCLAAVERERRSELSFEWGHRWLDLKRTGRINAVLGPLKPGWKPSAALFPIPQQEINRNPRLIQNDGY